MNGCGPIAGVAAVVALTGCLGDDFVPYEEVPFGVFADDGSAIAVVVTRGEAREERQLFGGTFTEYRNAVWEIVSVSPNGGPVLETLVEERAGGITNIGLHWMRGAGYLTVIWADPDGEWQFHRVSPADGSVLSLPADGALSPGPSGARIGRVRQVVCGNCPPRGRCCRHEVDVLDPATLEPIAGPTTIEFVNQHSAAGLVWLSADEFVIGATTEGAVFDADARLVRPSAPPACAEPSTTSSPRDQFGQRIRASISHGVIAVELYPSGAAWPDACAPEGS